MTPCSVCGRTSFVERKVLWDQLAAQWQLAPATTSQDYAVQTEFGADM